MRHAAAWLGGAALALAATHAHALNKCIDAKGKVSYQSAPCPERSRQEKVSVMPGPARQAAPKVDPAVAAGLLPAGEDRADPRMDEVVSMLADYEACEAASPAFAKANDASYRAWRSTNEELLDRLPRSRHYMAVLQADRMRARGRLAQVGHNAFVQSCEAEIGPAFAPRKPSR